MYDHPTTAIRSFNLISKRILPSVYLYFASNLYTTAFVLMNSSSLTDFGKGNSCLASTAASTVHLNDELYPGTAVTRMLNIRDRVKSLTPSQLSSDWDDVRRNILWAGGLKDLPFARPGYGYTGHSFNDYNHCDLTAMRDDEVENENQGLVDGIHFSNRLGQGIKMASLSELGPGGSWSTCMIGCAKNPPQDVAHLQFKSRIAFKLVWAPPKYETFVLIDDDGALLAKGAPTGSLPPLRERQQNYLVVKGSKYAVEADRVSILGT